ncbi:MAG: class I SAM-dependent methyltransferase [Myxococcota bacterium]
MDPLAQARALRDQQRNREALGKYAELVAARPEAGLLAEAAEVALRVDPPTAAQLAQQALALDPNHAIAAHHLAEAWARQGRHHDALTLYRRAVGRDGRLADLRHPGAKPWTRTDPERGCPSCGGAGEVVFVANATRVQTVFNRLDPIKVWSRCGGCGLVFTPTVPPGAELEAYYAAQRGSPAGLTPPDGRAVTQECLAWEPLLMRLEAAVGGPGRMFEVGSSWGVFLAAAAWRGWDVVGYELSPPAVAFSRATFGVRAEAVAIPEALPVWDPPADAAVLWEVLEHFPDPDAALAALASRVRPGGVVALSTPDLDHPAHRALGWDDPMWCVPGHLVYYDRATLDAAVRRAGLTVEQRWFSARHVGSVGLIARKG